MRILSISAAVAICSVAHAEVPDVVTDILPVQSLAAQVMAGVGTADVLLPPGASPHGYALRPSDARNLQKADVVFWIGPALTPWLADPLETLAVEAERIALMEIPGTEVLEARLDPLFETSDPHADHEQSHGGHADHDDDHGTEHEDTHDDHADEHTADEGHHHSGPDPHAWLDPANARLWLSVIADTLAATDPEHAEVYHTNAQAAIAALEVQEQQIANMLTSLNDRPFTVYHDAFQYFEHRFGLTPLGAIATSDATAPGPARLTALRDRLTDEGVICVFSEPQFNQGLIRAVSPQGAVHAVLDPIGSDLPAGAAHYPALLAALSGTISDCLSR
jgi:zinc transport system substrate-binding protein